jgi:hypothetical protein
MDGMHGDVGAESPNVEATRVESGDTNAATGKASFKAPCILKLSDCSFLNMAGTGPLSE